MVNIDVEELVKELTEGEGERVIYIHSGDKLIITDEGIYCIAYKLVDEGKFGVPLLVDEADAVKEIRETAFQIYGMRTLNLPFAFGDPRKVFDFWEGERELGFWVGRTERVDLSQRREV
ncbi:hypothetical protein M3_0143 [Lysinibacillus phage vB_LfM_LysYB1]|nr:hypothetical protein M3_0143 [Lysinibacillus phage vB_LfM_LysYB1]WAB25346.1 hypothetical protein M5_0168 [Lysinibacillus phage vB_LfM_LysYB2]